MTRRAVEARLGMVPAAPVGAPHGGEEVGDSRSDAVFRRGARQWFTAQ
jgi:hypothetical protein